MPDTNEVLDPNLLSNMIRQQKLLGTFSGGGLPSPIPESSPDLTVHHYHGTMPDPNLQPTVPDEPQTMQTGVAPSPSAPQAQPIPKIGPINPNSEAPAESAYKQALMNEPMHSDYHPSLARKIGGVAAGIGAGFLGGGVEGGIKVGDQVRDAPYNSRHQDWAQYAGNKNALATEEAAGTTTTGKAALTQAQIDEQNALAGLHRHETNTYHPVTAQEAIDQEQGKLKTDTREVKMADGTIKHLVQRNGLFYDPDTNVKVDRSAITDISDEGKSLKDTKAARIPANLQASVDARKIMATGIGGKTDDGITVDQPTLDAAKEYVKKLDDGQDPKGAYDDIVKTMETEKGRKLTSAEKIKLESTLHPPAVGPTILGPADTNTGTRQVLPLKPGVQVPSGSMTPSGVSTEQVQSDKTMRDTLKARQDVAHSYQVASQLASKPSATNDYALLMQFISATKPEGLQKLRLNNNEIKLVDGTRGLLGDVQAKLQKIQNGEMLTPSQRQSMLETLKTVAGVDNENPSQAASSQATHRYNPAAGKIEAITNAK